MSPQHVVGSNFWIMPSKIKFKATLQNSTQVPFNALKIENMSHNTYLNLYSPGDKPFRTSMGRSMSASTVFPISGPDTNSQ